MIYFLKGLIEEVGTDYLALDVNGVGYQAFCSQRTLASTQAGEALKLHIHSHVREQEFTLFGFASTEERDCFQLLTSVSGVGPKVGLAILTVLTAPEIASAIASSNGKMFARASGVGPKLGDRIVLDLKGKEGLISTQIDISYDTGSDASVSVSAPASKGVTADVRSALINLGYKPAHAEKAISIAMDDGVDVEDFDSLFKTCLQEMR